IVYVSNPPHYTTPGRYCRIWVTSSEVATQDFLYYVGHIRDETASPADGEDPEVRAAIDAAANAGVGNILETSFEVDRGAVAGRLAEWFLDRPFHHVHLGMLDMADQFSCVDPLPFLLPSASGTTGESLQIDDDESPTIASLELVPKDGSSAIVEDGFCGREVRGRFDVVLDATDTFYTRSPQPNPFPARDTIHPEIGIYGASYTVQRVDEPVGLTRQWYESPLGCLDTECGLWRLRYVGNRAAADLGELFRVLGAEAPSFAGAAIAEALWDTSRSTEMDYYVDLTDPVHYYHYLSNGVREDGTMDAEPGWDTTTLSDGRYVVTAKAWDRARNPCPPARS
ncbi:MAG: hypothetical protein JW751_27195, partial [Polyangiaceae bacterium]|nr:hypothetical protein [Polyangiaceae bacterium]